MRIKNFSLQVGSKIFKCLSDEARIRIISLLYQFDQVCVTDIETVLEFTQAKTSRHLVYLKNAGILLTKKQDQYVYYYIKEELLDIISSMVFFFEKDQVLNEDKETYEDLFAQQALAVCKSNVKKWS